MSIRSVAVAAAVAMLSRYQAEHLPALGPGMPTSKRRPRQAPGPNDLARMQTAQAKRDRRAAKRIGGEA